MKIGLLYYDDFAEFEIALACLLLSDQSIVSLGLENKVYLSQGKQKFLIDQTVDAIDPKTLDLLIIPGGDPELLYDNEGVKNLVQEVLDHGGKVAGICGGAILLAQLGFLKGKKCTGNACGINIKDLDYVHFKEAIVVEDQVCADGDIMTAQGQAYAEFAVNLKRFVGLYKSETEYSSEMNWVKNIRGMIQV